MGRSTLTCARLFWAPSWKLWLLLHALLAVGVGAQGQCNDNASCQKACKNALDAQVGEASFTRATADSSYACSRAVCVSAYRRCSCSSADALKRDSTCATEVPADRPLCNATHRAIFNAALWASPELSRRDVHAGLPSLQFRTVLDHGMIAALRLPSVHFAVKWRLLPVQFDRVADSSTVNTSKGGIIHFDLNIDFCARENQTLPALTSSSSLHAFERRFIGQVQEFEVLRMGTIALLELKPLQSTTPEPQSTTIRRGQRDIPGVTISLRRPGEERAASKRKDFEAPWMEIGMAWSFLVILLIALLCWITKQWKQGKPVQVINPSDFVFAGSEAAEMPDVISPQMANFYASMQGQFICVTKAFSGKEVEVEDHHRGSILTLSDGDVVEIIAECQGWYCGQMVGEPTSVGYFPSSCVASWLARPTADAQPMPLPQDDAFPMPQSPDNGTIQIKTGVAGAGDSCLDPVRLMEQCSDEPSFLPAEGDDPFEQPPPAYVCEALEFSLEEVEDAASRSKMLALTDGEVVEVMGGSGGWLFGKVLGAPERAGYFPDGRVASWLSTPWVDARLPNGQLQKPAPHVAGPQDESRVADADKEVAPADVDVLGADRDGSKEEPGGGEDVQNRALLQGTAIALLRNRSSIAVPSSPESKCSDWKEDERREGREGAEIDRFELPESQRKVEDDHVHSRHKSHEDREARRQSRHRDREKDGSRKKHRKSSRTIKDDGKPRTTQEAKPRTTAEGDCADAAWLVNARTGAQGECQVGAGLRIAGVVGEREGLSPPQEVIGMSEAEDCRLASVDATSAPVPAPSRFLQALRGKKAAVEVATPLLQLEAEMPAQEGPAAPSRFLLAMGKAEEQAPVPTPESPSRFLHALGRSQNPNVALQVRAALEASLQEAGAQRRAQR